MAFSNVSRTSRIKSPCVEYAAFVTFSLIVARSIGFLMIVKYSVESAGNKTFTGLRNGQQFLSYFWLLRTRKRRKHSFALTSTGTVFTTSALSLRSTERGELLPPSVLPATKWCSAQRESKYHSKCDDISRTCTDAGSSAQLNLTAFWNINLPLRINSGVVSACARSCSRSVRRSMGSEMSRLYSIINCGKTSTSGWSKCSFATCSIFCNLFSTRSQELSQEDKSLFLLLLFLLLFLLLVEPVKRAVCVSIDANFDPTDDFVGLGAAERTCADADGVGGATFGTGTGAVVAWLYKHKRKNGNVRAKSMQPLHLPNSSYLHCQAGRRR